jgi:NAD(P)H dehydrogenase (quinone)
MKVSILYHSVSGNTEKIADLIKKGVIETENVEAKCMSIENLDEKFIEESKLIFMGTPTYTGSLTWQMSKFIETNKINWKNKVCSVFATEKFLGGGADFAELSIIAHMLVKGMFVYSVGASEGLPYTHFGAICLDDGSNDIEQTKRAVIYGSRVTKNVLKEFKL